MRHSKSSSKWELYIDKCPIQEITKNSNNNPTSHLEEAEKEGQTKPKFNIRKEIVYTQVEIKDTHKSNK